MDTLYFYSKSKDAAPGKGAREQVADPMAYAALAKIKDWRKVLSNFHLGEPFSYMGRRWRTIEHAFQAMKLRLADEDKFHQLSMDSGSEVGLSGDGLAAQKKRKWVVLTPEQLKHWHAMSDATMAEIAKAKYAADPHAREVLFATGKAQLWHLVTRGKPVRFEHLEKLRTTLKKCF